MALRILISGASVAGNTAAFWLGREGLDVSVVERWPEFRDGGQNIDVRDTGREVLRRMNLEDEALSCGTREEGTAWINEKGAVVAKFVTAEIGADGPTAELEILRGDLAALIYERARKQARYRFGDSIDTIEDDGRGVTVGFRNGTVERYDAVIVAEGVGSQTRERIFHGENDERWMDLTIAYFTIPRVAGDDRLWRWYNATNGRSISLRPDNHGTTRAMLSIQKSPDGEQDWDRGRQIAFLKESFRDAGWQAERVLSGLETTKDYYFDVLRQVRMQRWSRGRIALTGDAAWCATPMAGIGASIAITGAYVLAMELARKTDVETAFAAYETTMRPMVEDGQGVPKFATKLMNPKSRAGIAVLHAVLRAASHPVVRGIAGKAFSRKPKHPDLEVYRSAPAPVRTGTRGASG